MDTRECLAVLLSGRTLGTADAERLFEDILGGIVDDAQIGAALALIQQRFPSEDELVGGALSMRRHVERVPALDDVLDRVIDTCGTGGARKTFNVSTLSALVAAAAAPGRVLVAKHGNRGRSGRGSAELLRELGVNIDATPAVQSRCLRECGVCFCFAVHHHPAMKHAAKARQSLGFATVFNVLGPLTNPAGARRQVMGVFDVRLVELVAKVQVRLGCHRAMIVHGSDGIDEITTTGATRIAHVAGQTVAIEEFDPIRLGVARSSSADLDAADLHDAARIARSVLEGAPGPAADIVAVNAAASLIVADVAPDWAAALARVREVMSEGRPARVLDDLVRLSREAV